MNGSLPSKYLHNVICSFLIVPLVRFEQLYTDAIHVAYTRNDRLYSVQNLNSFIFSLSLEPTLVTSITTQQNKSNFVVVIWVKKHVQADVEYARAIYCLLSKSSDPSITLLSHRFILAMVKRIFSKRRHTRFRSLFRHFCFMDKRRQKI